MNFLNILILAIVLVALAFAGLGITILLKKGGKFPNTHVSGNKYLRQKGIYCAQTQDKLEQKKAREEFNFKNLKVGKAE
ncbi:MAG TPA: hypothetical protein P5086_04425 [Prolixibacteraceae bacterium]|nr:hypothetical protein [Prolixibacteraceae bacterium]HPJ79285.1 hypothetical protein [Prolixibacteraceae bacterium]HRV88538.1 hypothetical protein [Prolixibacteraceae bacterium]